MRCLWVMGCVSIGGGSRSAACCGCLARFAGGRAAQQSSAYRDLGEPVAVPTVTIYGVCKVIFREATEYGNAREESAGVRTDRVG